MTIATSASSSDNNNNNNNNNIWIYHERQEALLCGQHALNNLVQSPVFTVAQLANIAHQLDQLEQGVMERSAASQPSANVDAAGNFSIQVLKAALQEVYGVALTHLSVLLQQVSDITQVQGFIVHKSDHWFAIREIGGRFWNLNSMLELPQPVSHFQIGTEMEKWQQEGYTIFGIPRGLPPAGEKDEGIPSSGKWHLMSDLLKGKATAEDPWASLSGSGMRLDSTTSSSSSNDFLSREDRDLQIALKASLADVTLQELPNVPDEPPEGAKGAVRIQIRMPDGKRIVRRFYETDSVKAIYAVVRQEDSSSNHLQKSVELRSGFPPKDMISLQGQTIGQAKLAGESIQGRYV